MKAKSIKGKSPEEIKVALEQSMTAVISHHWLLAFHPALEMYFKYQGQEKLA